MLVDASRKLYTINKEEIPDVSGKEEVRCPNCDAIIEESSIRNVPLTLRTVFSVALQAPVESDVKRSMKERTDIFALLLKVHKEDVQEYSSTEITTLKERVALRYNNLILGQVDRILEIGINPLEPSAGEDVEDVTDGAEEVKNTESAE